MTFLFLAAFIAGLLLGVRVMFFGAERRRLQPADAMPLRRSEPAIVGFLLMFGVAGYLLTRHGTVSGPAGIAIAEGQEVCIERVEDEVAFVELWAIVEQRL